MIDLGTVTGKVRSVKYIGLKVVQGNGFSPSFGIFHYILLLEWTVPPGSLGTAWIYAFYLGLAGRVHTSLVPRIS